MEALLVALGGVLSILGGVTAAYIQGKFNAQAEDRKRREVLQDVQANRAVELSQSGHEFIGILARLSNVAGRAQDLYELVQSDSYSRYLQAGNDYSQVLGGIHIRFPDFALFEAALALRAHKEKINRSLAAFAAVLDAEKSSELDGGKLFSDLHEEHKKYLDAFEETARNRLFGTVTAAKPRLDTSSFKGPPKQ